MNRFSVTVAALILLAACTPSATPPPSKPKTPPQALKPVPPRPLLTTIEAIRAELTAPGGDRTLADRSLAALAASSTDPSVKRQALAIRGLQLASSGRPADAVPVLTAAIDAWPGIAPFLRLQLAEAARAAGDLPRAVAAARDVVTLSPASTASDIAKIRMTDYLVESGDRAGAVDWLERNRVLFSNLNELEFFELTERLDRAGSPEIADTIRVRFVRQFPQSRHIEPIYAALRARTEEALIPIGGGVLVEIAENLAGANRYDQAFNLLELVKERFPLMAAADTYRYIMASSLFASRRYDELADIRTEQGEKFNLKIRLLQARGNWRRGKNDLFLSGMNSILAEAGVTNAESRAARVYLSKYYATDEVNYPKSIELLQKAVDIGTLGNEGENVWTLGWTQILAGRESAALATFDGYIAAYPDGDYTSNALFWSGKIHSRHGRTAERDAAFTKLIALYPNSYYGYRARELSGLPYPDESALPPFPVITETPAEGLDVVRDLMSVGLDRDAARELQRINLKGTDPSLSYQLAELYQTVGEPLRANGILQKQFRDTVRHGGKGVPQRFWEILYPRFYWDTIQTEAARVAIDPYLVAAVIRQESGWEPTVVSNAGAVGLMQIMPAEAGRIAEKAGLPPITRQDLFDPRRNIAIGASEIRQKLDVIGGNQILAIASYNAGEDAVGRWVAKTPLDDIDVFIESIPYAETKLYVKTVTRNLSEYRRIYGSP